METLVNDFRFTLYNVCYKRVSIQLANLSENIFILILFPFFSMQFFFSFEHEGVAVLGVICIRRFARITLLGTKRYSIVQFGRWMAVLECGRNFHMHVG